MQTRNESIPVPRDSSAYRPEIDGLRAIAVVAVLLNHIHPASLPGGFLGVDLFFVISGYVVTASLARRKEESWRQMLTGFYARRFRRLLPALLLMVVVTSVLFSLVVSPASELHRSSLRTGLMALFGVSNLYLLRQGNNYFDFGTQFNPFLHTWSLGVEEQFYLFWPVLLIICGVGFAERGRKSLLILLIVTAALILLSLLFYLFLLTRHQEASFFLMPARFWELSAGSLVFCLQAIWPVQERTKMALRFTCWLEVGLCTLLFLGFILAPERAVQFKPVFVVATAALLATLQASRWIGRWLSQPAMLRVGTASYSLYLCHWPLIVLLRWTIGINAWTVIPLLACIAFATAVSTWVEARFRYGSITSRGLGQPLIIYPVITLLVGIFVVSLDQFARGYIFLGNRKANPDESSRLRQVYGTTITTANCFLEPMEPIAASKNSQQCLQRLRNKKPTIFLEGDSISHSMLPLLNQVYSTGRFNVGFFARGGCPIPYVEPWANNLHLARRYRSCRQHARIREQVLLKAVHPGDQLMLVTNTYVSGRLSEQSYEAAISRLAELLRERKAGLILFSPLPVFAERESIRSPLSLCSPDWFRPAWAIPVECRPYFVSRQSLLQANLSLTNLQMRLKAQHLNISLFNPFPLLCPPGQTHCSTHQNGLMLFNDGIHLTSRGARLIYPQFQSFLDQIIKRS